jgi:hypothetical protein
MYQRADAETLEGRQRLAHWVRDDLACAGLTITPGLGIDYRIGAEVVIDEGDDSTGGVWVSWHAHPHLRIAAVQLVAKHRHEAAHDPIVKHAGAVSQAMCDAMLAILISLGYRAIPSDDSLRPYALKVISGPAKALLPEPEF